LQSAIQPFVFSSWEAQVDPIYYEIPEDQQIAVSYKVDDGIEKTANAIIDETGKITLKLSELKAEKGQNVIFKVSVPTKSGVGDHQTSFYSSAEGNFETQENVINIESDSSYFWIKNALVPPEITRLEPSKL